MRPVALHGEPTVGERNKRLVLFIDHRHTIRQRVQPNRRYWWVRKTHDQLEHALLHHDLRQRRLERDFVLRVARKQFNQFAAQKTVLVDKFALFHHLREAARVRMLVWDVCLTPKSLQHVLSFLTTCLFPNVHNFLRQEGDCCFLLFGSFFL